ncbi:hypothetical protein M2322_002734 [Rhodoblastus acidophilus]|uniref:hypothetical protein n=1 Tax=Rhodoblastus acidophilus TaxID=1074 RepID=UPI0022246545|nr:hypothetical protein [Rhodoblastus acidophilus]MCW2317180.1 hypothetical protein [Rhodoblastus acidophilus]
MRREQQLRERLRKVDALRRGAVTNGEREAAEAALARLNLKLRETGRAEGADAFRFGFPGGLPFSVPGAWPVQLFMSLCVVAMASGLAVLHASATRRS